MPRTRANRRERSMPSRFGWKPEDVTITYPTQPKAVEGMDDELHTILWSLEGVGTKAQFHDVMLNVALYLADHPGDPLVAAAVTRVEQRLEHAT